MPRLMNGKAIFVTFVSFFMVNFLSAQLLKVGVVGLNHDHAHEIASQYKNKEVIILGVAENDPNLIARYKKQYGLPDSIFYPDLATMLKRIPKPDAVLAYNAIADHIDVVEQCAPKGISVMVEKPLATTVQQVERMEMLAKKNKIHLLTNYETTWYGTNQQVYEMVNKEGIAGKIRKMVVHMGHQGPREIGCSEEFLSWLTDPVKNGGGALIDFGCYGANIMTWLMKGKKPISVSAVTKQIKPSIYPKVDDDATILIEYDDAIGIVEASWNWPYGIKDLEVFGEKSYLHALNRSEMLRRDTIKYYNVEVKPPVYKNNLTYLAAVLSGKYDPANDLSSLENNVMVVRILDAARRSAKEGRKIVL